MSVKIFLSSVSDEFREYRDQLRGDLTRHDVDVKVQEDFKDLGGDTLSKLDSYIRHCDAVVHLIGDMTGSVPGTMEQEALAAKYPDMTKVLPPLGEAIAAGSYISYTQWEAWLALYHGKLLLTAEAEPTAPRGPKYAVSDDGRRAQTDHLGRLRAVRRYPGSKFASAADLARHIAYTAILDLLVQDYAQAEARAREVAEGFIREMAGRVSRDSGLDLNGMKETVRNAIELYEKEIAGQVTTSNIDSIVDRALARAREQVDVGKSGLAKVTLRRAAEDMRRDEEERRERYEQGVTVLYRQERDIALAGYDAEGAAAATLELATALHGDAGLRLKFLELEADALHEIGTQMGSGVHFAAEANIRRSTLDLVDREALPSHWAAAQYRLAGVLEDLGVRELGTSRLEEAIGAYRLALEEWTRDRFPREWVKTQRDLGGALLSLGARESGIDTLKEAAAALRHALTETSREEAPFPWALMHNSLGMVLSTIGERTRDTVWLEEAANTYRLALEELAREGDPTIWAAVQNNLGNVLRAQGEIEGINARFEDAINAFRSALEEYPREEIPAQWAAIQNNLGNALRSLGERRSYITELEEAAVVHRLALEVFTRERDPIGWGQGLYNLGVTLELIGVRTASLSVLQEARSVLVSGRDTCRDVGYLEREPYFAERLAAIDAALAALD